MSPVVVVIRFETHCMCVHCLGVDFIFCVSESNCFLRHRCHRLSQSDTALGIHKLLCDKIAVKESTATRTQTLC